MTELMKKNEITLDQAQELVDNWIKTVGNYLIALEKAGFLTAKKVGKEKLYLNTALMRILENNTLE